MVKKSNTQKLQNLLTGYYLATPLFLLLDLGLGWHLRLAIPGQMNLPWYLYYAGCFFIGYLLWGGTVLGNLLAILESGINITLLLLSVLLPLFYLDDSLSQPGRPGLTDVVQVVHFFLVGGVLLLAFYTNPLVAGKGT